MITLVTLVSPYRADRDAARKRHEEQGIKFIEVLMDVPLDVVQVYSCAHSLRAGRAAVNHRTSP